MPPPPFECVRVVCHAIPPRRAGETSGSEDAPSENVRRRRALEGGGEAGDKTVRRGRARTAREGEKREERRRHAPAETQPPKLPEQIKTREV